MSKQAEIKVNNKRKIREKLKTIHMKDVPDGSYPAVVTYNYVKDKGKAVLTTTIMLKSLKYTGGITFPQLLFDENNKPNEEVVKLGKE